MVDRDAIEIDSLMQRTRGWIEIEPDVYVERAVLLNCIVQEGRVKLCGTLGAQCWNQACLDLSGNGVFRKNNKRSGMSHKYEGVGYKLRIRRTTFANVSVA